MLSRVSISDGTNVEEIQNQVEVALMAEHYYSVVKRICCIVKNIWKTVKSETNLNSSWIIAMLPTLPAVEVRCQRQCGKQEYRHADRRTAQINFIRLNRRLLTDRLRDMYGKEASDRYLELLNHHFIYKK